MSGIPKHLGAGLCLLLILLPLWAAGAAESHTYPSLTAWPLATHSADADGSTTSVLFGVVHYEERGNFTRFAVRPWLFNLETDADRDYRELSVAFDLWHSEHRGEDFRRHLFPVYWQGRTGAERWFHLWPFFGAEVATDGAHTIATLYPLFSLTTYPAAENWTARYLWPLGETRRQGEVTTSRLLPFWWRHVGPQRSDGMLFPYLWLNHGDSHTGAILPLWWWNTTPQSSFGFLFPYLWRETAETRSDALLPLWWHTRTPQSRFSLLVPLYYGWKTPKSAGSLLLPVWYSTHGGDSEVTVLFPLYLDRTASSGTRLQLVLPVYSDYHSESSATRVIFPFYFRHSNEVFASTLSYWFPFFGSYEREAVTERYYLFPLYAHMQDTARGYDSHFALWPLIHHETLPDARDSWLLPLFRSRRSADGSDTMAALLWWSGHSPEVDYTLLLPLYGHLRTPESEQTHVPLLYSDLRRSDGYRKRFFLGPLAIDTVDPQEQRRQFDLLWPLISNSTTATTTHTRVLPFWWHEKRPEQSLSVGSLALLPPYYLHLETATTTLWHLWPFYGQSRDGDFREDAILWPFLRYGSDDTGVRRSWQAVIVYGSADAERSSFGLFPLWHHRRDGDAILDISLLHWHERSAGASNFALLHLGDPAWSLINLEQSPVRQHQHLFPLYTSTRTTQPDATRVAVVWPLYVYKREAEQAQHALLWKLLFYEHGPQTTESGFLWRFIHARRDEQAALFEFNPFYYRETQRDGSEDYTAWLGGIYASQSSGEGTEHRLFWFLHWQVAAAQPVAGGKGGSEED